MSDLVPYTLMEISDYAHEHGLTDADVRAVFNAGLAARAFFTSAPQPPLLPVELVMPVPAGPLSEDDLPICGLGQGAYQGDSFGDTPLDLVA